MASPVRIVGKKTGREDQEGIAAQVDDHGNLMIREGARNGLPKPYEQTTFSSDLSPVTHDFYTDMGRYAEDGYVTCDGAGNIEVSISQDGITYSSDWTMKSGETVDLLRLDIKKIRVKWVTADSSYRIFLV